MKLAMDWLILILAGITEIAWATALKYTEGFTKLYPVIFTLVLGLLSLWLLSISMKTIPLGTAYAVWTGIGIIGTSIIGMSALHEPTQWFRLIFLMCVLIGIIGLKWTEHWN
jgi:quaternary ammonium compound-resistance protein SugE